MSEKIEKLVRMANQIADFFAPYSEAEAVAGVQRAHPFVLDAAACARSCSPSPTPGGKGLKPP